MPNVLVEVVSKWHRKNEEQYNHTYYLAHKKEIKAKAKEYRETHRKANAVWHRQGRQREKERVISHYSNGTMACKRCGFSDIRALSIDHIKGNGAKERRTIGMPKGGGDFFYRWLKKQNYPEGYQVLCMNCQWIKRSENSEVPHRY